MRAFGNQTDDRYGGGGTFGAYGSAGDDYSIRPADTWGGSGFASPDNHGRRFDRIDAGSTGTHGAHPMSSPVGGGYGSSAGMFGSGFTFRLARAEAEAAGGALVRHEDCVRLELPVLTATAEGFDRSENGGSTAA